MTKQSFTLLPLIINCVSTNSSSSWCFIIDNMYLSRKLASLDQLSLCQNFLRPLLNIYSLKENYRNIVNSFRELAQCIFSRDFNFTFILSKLESKPFLWYSTILLISVQNHSSPSLQVKFLKRPHINQALLGIFFFPKWASFTCSSIVSLNLMCLLGVQLLICMRSVEKKTCSVSVWWNA